MNRKNGRRVLALCLMLVLLLSLAPMRAWAAGAASLAPPTGDDNNIVLWIVILAAALAAIGILVWSLLRKGKKK